MTARQSTLDQIHSTQYISARHAMRLEIRQYTEKSEAVSFMFDLLRHSIKELSTAAFRRYMEAVRKPREANLKQLIGFLSVDAATASIIPDVTKHHQRRLRSDLPITPGLKWAENKGATQLAINASELILRVALFEAFLKQVHHHALMAKQQLLGVVKPKRTIALRELFGSGFDRVRDEEIRRQVREGDRLKTKEKAKFFERHLKLKWGDDSTIKRVDELIELRHKLVHASPDKPVTPKDIEDIRNLFEMVIRTCFQMACKVYPSKFKH